MKKNLITLALTVLLTTTAQANTFFDNVFSLAQESGLSQQVQEAHKIMSLVARLSVYALMCGDTADNVLVSNKYRELFTEGSKGMVTFGGFVFTNPIEKMRNRAMLDFITVRDQNNLGQQMCSANRSKFIFYSHMTPTQLIEFARNNDLPDDSLLSVEANTEE